jgi:hypothetical protein
MTMSAVISLWESLTKCQTITSFIVSSNDKLFQKVSCTTKTSKGLEANSNLRWQ